MIDTHCHLTFPDFSGPKAGPHSVPATLAEARAAGVTGCITISTTTQDCLTALAIAEAHDRVWSTAGVHPCYADKGPHNWANLRRCFASPKCVAWGELGLDNHYPKPAKEIQHAVLHEQLAFIQSCRTPPAASASGPVIDKPIVIHCREAFADLIPILKQTTLDPARFVFHCFTGSPADMRLLLDFGAMVSFTGVVTYKNAAEVREAVKLAPLSRIMVETDAPFLPPEPVRSERPCRPAHVRHTAESLAATRSEPFDAFHAAINENTCRFFGIDAF